MKPLLIFAARMLGISAIISALISLVCYLIGWRDPEQFSNVLTVAGILIMGMGVLSSSSNSSRADFQTLYTQTASSQTLEQRSKRWVADSNQNFSVVVRFFLIGLFVLLAGTLIGQLG